MPSQGQYNGSCHCGAVAFTVALPDGLRAVGRCDCSLCRRRGAIMAHTGLDGLRIIRGQAVLRLYQFNSRVAKHYFCSICGIYTHHQRRSDPSQYGINIGCLDGLDALEPGAVQTYDGVNHPSDRATAKPPTPR